MEPEQNVENSAFHRDESKDCSQKLSVRIVNVDYYLCKPVAVLQDACYSAFRSSPVYHVPVIRIFGPTSEGVKTCLHIHGVFPYIYLPNWSDEITDKNMYEFAQMLDKHINISFGNSTSKAMHIYRITKVWRRPFYGYHDKEKQFLKLEFYNPTMIKRATELLQNGAVFNMRFQPYEAHIPYILSFFIDNNLYGMSYINLASYRTRSSDLAHSKSIQSLNDDETDNINKQSYCVFEIDASVSDLRNVHQDENNTPNNPGLAFIWEEECKLRRQHGRVSQITPILSQIRPKRDYTRTELYFKNKMAEKLHSFENKQDSNKVLKSFHESDDSVGDFSQNSNTNSDTKQELNTQCREILAIMEEIAMDSAKNTRPNSQHSYTGSPSVIPTDDESQLERDDMSLISSQPLLKQVVEEDSILGNKFSSDDDLEDDNDHLTLSQPLNVFSNEKDFSSCTASSDSDDCQIIPQLDGATFDSSRSNTRHRSASLLRKSAATHPTRSKKSYNLRSKNAKSKDAISENFTKNSPGKNHYPQLQIDVQKSPKSSTARDSLSRIQDLSSPSTSSTLPSANSDTGYILSRDCSPSSKLAELDRKRIPYPQLDVNIKKSPKLVARFAASEKRTATLTKKRKLEFENCTSDSVSVGSDGVALPSLDVTSLTARWKKLRLKRKSAENPVSSENTFKISCNRSTENLWDEILGNSPPLWSAGERETSKRESDQQSCHAVGLDRGFVENVDVESLFEDVRTRKPVVKLVRLRGYGRAANANRTANLQVSDALVSRCSSKTETQMGIDDGVELMRAAVPVSVENTLLSRSSESNDSRSSESNDSRFKELRINEDKIKDDYSSQSVTTERKPKRRRLGVRMTLKKTDQRLHESDNFRSQLVAETNMSSTSSWCKISAKCEPKNESTFVAAEDYGPKDENDAIVLKSDGENGGPNTAVQEDSGQFSDICLEIRPTTEESTTQPSLKLLYSLSEPVALFNSQKDNTNSGIDEENGGKEGVVCLASTKKEENEEEEDKFAEIPSFDGQEEPDQMKSEFENTSPLPASANVEDSMFNGTLSTTKESNETNKRRISNNNSDESIIVMDSEQSDDGCSNEHGENCSWTLPIPSAKANLVLNNSVWDSIEDDNENEDERICSFYCNPSQMNADSSPLTESMSVLDVEASQPSTSAVLSNETSAVRFERGNCDADKNREKTQSPNLANVVAHSTPRSTSTKSDEQRRRRQTSPNYTPISKKFVRSESPLTRRHISTPERRRKSAKFNFLRTIHENQDDDESIENSKNVSFPLPSSSPTVLCDEDKHRASITPINDTVAHHSCSVIRESSDRDCDGSLNSVEIDTTTLNSYGFRMDLENLRNVKTDAQHHYITVVSLELFVETRLDLNPDPEYDKIRGLFYSIYHDVPHFSKLISGVIIVNSDCLDVSDILRFGCDKTFVPDENALYDRFIELIRQWDPDIFVGYEIEMLSWGYFIQRGKYLHRNCDKELSRVHETKYKNEEKTLTGIEDDADYSNDVKLVGRIILNVWRLMRHEIALQSYTFENIVYHVLHQRIPHHSFESLTRWWASLLKRWIIVDYYLYRVEINILLLQQLDFFGRTSELAKLFGIQFYEVLSRGSQFRVESMMLRLAKRQNFVAVSPNVKQRAAMRAPECLPLIMEPESNFYTDPVIVLDFQSLYPSIIIAYNYCFSTCLGRVQHLASEENFEFGCLRHSVPKDMLLKFESFLNYSPCGVAFVNKEVRSGILPSMLQEILDTRLMVKKSMKENKKNSILQRVLHARQLGLKLIANVTYGYTSANFSGRMPCIEVGDSVVSKGRETLERAIELITNNRKWGARVIYGDTDSIFVLVPSRSKEAAFEIGSQIVEAVTNDNPKPVKLKLEKVYYPCILQTKKRYVGYMYESADQKEPVYDAKGIETVRRDGCPAVSKILEKSLKLLFESKKVDVVKRYVQRQFIKIMSDQMSIRELIFAKEYRGMHNYKPTACVPALKIAKQAITRDRRSEPRIRERVPYVVVVGPPGVPLINLVRTPRQFLENVGSIINAEYYITRAIIPALERCFSLMNVNVQSWYKELPKTKRIFLPAENDVTNITRKKTNISHYFVSSKCVACNEMAYSGVCRSCQLDTRRLAIVIGNRINLWQRNYNYTSKICGSCCGRGDPIECTSLDCPILYNLHKSSRELEQIPYIEELQQKYLRNELSDR